MKKQIFLTLVSIWLFGQINAQHTLIIDNLELPKITKQDVVIKHLGYTLSYSEKHEQANWVAYELTATETIKKVNRSNDFRPDMAVMTGSATNEDYQGSGYDRGHLAPAADMGWSVQAMEESFFYSNMSPQVTGFNRGIWKKLEEQVRQWAVDNKVLYVVTGPVLENNLPTIGPDKVSVPRFYYKVILDYTEPELKGIGFIIPNASSTISLKSFAVPIDSVEHITGIDFFPTLPDEQERVIEKTICLNCWTWTSTSTHNGKIKNDNKSTSVQCSSITKSGSRCKRMTLNPSGICTQHENK